MKSTLNFVELQNIETHSITVYKDKDTEKTVSIQAGVQPWTWIVKSECPILQKNARSIADAYVMQGMKQHEYKGGFAEAILTLKVKLKV